ncbi:MAG: phosphocarrier protein HPr [Kiritimatiellia bacterium]|jgi:phosphocarrier protein HPr
MIKKSLVIINKLGLHARAAAKLTGLAGRFSSKIELSVKDKTVDCKSVMSLMLLAASKGTPIELTTDGKDEVDAINAIEALINNRFDEAE